MAIFPSDEPACFLPMTMSFKHLEEQSWLDLFLLALPVLLPLAISLYFIATEESRPEAHADPPQVHDDPKGIHEHVKSGSAESQVPYETTQSKGPVTFGAELRTRAHHLSYRFNTLDNRIHHCLDSTRMRYLHSELQSAALYRVQKRIRELEVEAESLAR